jgi:uncharacterized protein (TIGR02145 family)
VGITRIIHYKVFTILLVISVALCGCSKNNDEEEVKIPVEPIFPCPGVPEVTYGWQSYSTVLIGDQCWLKENLNVGEIINSFDDQTNNEVIEKYCYQNKPENCKIYGGLYQWHEMMNYNFQEGGRGICPYGWHIPTIDEWNEMINLLGGPDVAGKKMKITGEEFWRNSDTETTNESEFSALPAGCYEFIWRIWRGLGSEANYWTSNIDATPYAKMIYLRSGKDFAINERGRMTRGYSVRCIKD